MKTAVYRTSDDSVLVGSLIQCAEDGKQSVCLVELKARFDELRNIEWSRALEQAGVHVAYGFPDLKIHAKMTLIVRREGDALRRYAHIGTGNYHAATARLYEDLGIFTADEEITADVADLFNYITGFGRPQKFRKLLVAPFTLRSGLVDEIRAVAAAAADGKARAHPAQAQPSRRPEDRRRALRGVPCRRSGRHHRPLDVRASAGRRRPVGEHPRPLDRRPLPRAQPRVLLRGRRARRHVHREPRPHAAQPRPPNRGARTGRERACSAGDPRASSTARSRTTRTHGSSCASGEWVRAVPAEAGEGVLTSRGDDATLVEARTSRRPRPACRIARRPPKSSSSASTTPGAARWRPGSCACARRGGSTSAPRAAIRPTRSTRPSSRPWPRSAST